MDEVFEHSKEESVKKRPKGKNKFVIHFGKGTQRLSSLDEEDDLVEDKRKKYKSGRWTIDEHQRFVRGCLLYGNNWKKVNFILNFSLLKIFISQNLLIYSLHFLKPLINY